MIRKNNIMSKEEIIKIISEHPNYSKEKFFKKHFPEQYHDILNIEFSIALEFRQKVYHYLHNDIELYFGKCKTCGKRTKYRSFSYGYFNYCSSKCAQNAEETRHKIEETNKAKYGNPFLANL